MANEEKESIDCPVCNYRMEVPSSESPDDDMIQVQCTNSRCEHMLTLDRVCYWTVTAVDE